MFASVLVHIEASPETLSSTSSYVCIDGIVADNEDPYMASFATMPFNYIIFG